MKHAAEINLKRITEEKSFFPSPINWEDQVLYFLLIDRFSDGKEKELYNNDKDYENALRDEKTKKTWLEYGDKWNGGNLKGLESKLGYLKKMGVTAIWISPVFKQVPFEESYHGYGIQNFLEVDPHMGTKKDLKELVKSAHQQGIYVILDVIINHTGNVFRYEETDTPYNGNEYNVKAFHDKEGEPTIPIDNIEIEKVWPDGGVWPQELMNLNTFTRKGYIVNWDAYPEYTHGDFYSLKNINSGSGGLNNFQPSDAFKIITECYKYWLAYADVDGFRLDTVKHLEPGAVRYFVTEIHEFANSIGKSNFYVFGEIMGGYEFAIDNLKQTGIDAALGINKIPETLENVAKGYLDPIEFFNLFKNSELLGEDEYKWYRNNVVTMFDDHDMVTQAHNKSRFCADKSTAQLLTNSLFLNLMSPGIPCIYYGTEQCFDGSGDSDKYVRESMFGGNFGAFRTYGKHFFDEKNPVFVELSKIIKTRNEYIALRQGRFYQREISYEGEEFHLSHKLGNERHSGIVAWSRILSSDEIVLAANCDLENNRNVNVLIDTTLHKPDEEFKCIYSTDSSQVGSRTKVIDIEGRLVLNLTVPIHGCCAYYKE